MLVKNGTGNLVMKPIFTLSCAWAVPDAAASASASPPSNRLSPIAAPPGLTVALGGATLVSAASGGGSPSRLGPHDHRHQVLLVRPLGPQLPHLAALAQ